MDILSIIDELERGNVAPVYIFYGEERFLIDTAFSQIKQQVLSGPMSDFNLVLLRAGKTSGAEIAAEGMQMPMLSSRRLVVVELGEKLNKADWEALAPYLADPPATATLVIIADKLNANLGVLRKAKKNGQLHKAEKIKQRGAGAYVKSAAKKRGVKMAPAAIAALANAVGTDCAALDDAVERLGLYAGPEQTVTENDVAEVVTSVREHSIFELVDAVGMRRSAQAMTLLEGLLDRREEPIRINAMVARHIRLLLKTRIAIHERVDRAELPRLLGVPGFVANKLVDQAGRVSGIILQQFLATVSKTDYELKSSRRPSRLVVEQAIMSLCV